MAIVYGNQVPRVQKREIIAEKPKIYGLNFPIGTNINAPNLNKGYFSKQSGITLAKGNLKQLLSTFPGERVMLPLYGLDLRQFLFEPLDDFTFAEIRERITTQVDKYLPEISIVKLSVKATSEIGYSGIPGIIITLSFRLADDYNSVPSDIIVKVGV